MALMFCVPALGGGALHPEVQGRRRHEQLRRLRGGAAPNFVDRKVRQGVLRVLSKPECPSVTAAAVVVVVDVDMGGNCYPTKTKNLPKYEEDELIKKQKAAD